MIFIFLLEIFSLFFLEALNEKQTKIFLVKLTEETSTNKALKTKEILIQNFNVKYNDKILHKKK